MKDVIYSGNIQQRVLFININCVILGSAGSQRHCGQRPEFACPKIGAATNNRVFTGIHRYLPGAAVFMSRITCNLKFLCSGLHGIHYPGVDQRY